jgi:hypothetical protein
MIICDELTDSLIDLKILFPNITIPHYESLNKLDNKTTSLFIPDGKKRFAWFMKRNDKPMCLILEKNDECDNHENGIVNIEFKYSSFSVELTKGIGTIIYGTLVHNSFYCESLHYFKGLNITGTLMDKYILTKNIFQYIYFSNFTNTLEFHLPYMSNSKYILEASNLPYPVRYILQFNNNKPKLFDLNELIGSFKILKRDEYEDVYELWVLDNNKTFYEFYSTALVNDFKTSHFLKNDLFDLNIDYRNSQFLKDSILDDFEWKFNQKDFFVGCIFIPEFRKWKPLIQKKDADILKTIQNIEKKNI